MSAQDPAIDPAGSQAVGQVPPQADLNDVFSLRQPKDAGAGFSSGAKSIAKVMAVLFA